MEGLIFGILRYFVESYFKKDSDMLRGTFKPLYNL